MSLFSVSQYGYAVYFSVRTSHDVRNANPLLNIYAAASRSLEKDRVELRASYSKPAVTVGREAVRRRKLPVNDRAVRGVHLHTCELCCSGALDFLEHAE